MEAGAARVVPPEPAGLEPALAVPDVCLPTPPRPGTVVRPVVGARPVPADTWLRPGPADAPLLAWKRAVLDAAGPLATLTRPGTEAAGEEVLGLVTAAVGAPVVEDAGRHPLEVAARLVVEDLCLLDVRGPAPVLVAGCVAMPSRWRLADKIGRDMLGVHGPVPGYAEHIGTPTDRLLARLTPGRILARTAWTLTDDPALFQPADTSRRERARPEVRTAEDAARHLFLRSEYQTVRALPGSGAVLFTIRTAREPFGALAARPDAAAALLAVIGAMTPDQVEYKGVAPYLGPVTAWLRGSAGVPGASRP